MNHHLGTIHTIRFSSNGRYLASGADDKIICIYYLDDSPTPSVNFGSTEPAPVENWKTHKRLVGHENDVQDLAWSADSSLLVSVGLDSKIVVWSGHTFEKLKTISIHHSHVKGITFDPANKFFATASDDRTIRIFRFTPPPPNATQHDLVNNFVHEATISQPFKSSPLTTYFRRCSWSPDGNHIAAANATNGPVSSVAIIDRNTWDSEINLIGHEQPTEVCLFSPRLFHTSKPTENGITNGQSSGGMLVTVIASSGQDKTLSIWNTNTSRPLVILQDLAAKSISDLAWSPDGQTLFACSLDGTIIALQFEAGELGWVATPEENDKALQKYGASRKGMGTAEDVDELKLEQHSKEGELRGAESRMGALMGDVPKTPALNGMKTKEQVTRESPPNPEEIGNGKEPERLTEETPSKTEQRITELKSRVTVGRDGKKRVAPLLVSGSGTGQLSLPQSQLVGSTSTRTAQEADKPRSILDISRPYDGLPEKGLAALLMGNKRKAADMDDERNDDSVSKKPLNGPLPILVNGVDGVEPVAPHSQPSPPVIPEYLRPAIISPCMSVAQVRLGVPKVRSKIVREMEKGSLKDEMDSGEAPQYPENSILQVKNPAQIRDPSHVTVTKRGALLWEDYLPRAALLVAGSKNLWAVACEDGAVYAWTPAGRRLVNCLQMSGQPCILGCREYWLLCISSIGFAHVWNLHTLTAPFPPVSLAAPLEAASTMLQNSGPTVAPSLTSAHLTSRGYVVITLNNGAGYYYDPQMYTWQRASETWWAVGSQYWNSNDSSVSALRSTAVGPISKGMKSKESLVSAGIVPYLERHTTNEFLLKGRAFALQRIVKDLLNKEGFENFEACVSIAHLENRIAAALQLGSTQEFAEYVCMYAKRLGAEGHRGKVEELLAAILGKLLEEKDAESQPDWIARGWSTSGDKICGWDRKELLRAVVMVLGKFSGFATIPPPHHLVLNCRHILIV